MNADDLCNAIIKRNQIEFFYHDKYRKGNPQCYGLSKTGKPTLRVHLIEGGDRPEQLFTTNKMTDLKILPTTFTTPGPNYRRDDSAFKEIFCQL